ncbi:hypothetical protein [Micromonospora zingiberis]|uniref:hypothetical protein n=1 Tax=Micromonospora zingiberis TaxID=2053011 RepID=UPI00197E01C9|nr:hypothetical protein [Micromonospora zingiberis]
MFGIGRRKTQGQLARAELNRSVGHLRQAATHAARGAGATVGPRVQAARSAVTPATVMIRDRTSSGLATTAAALAPLAMAVRQAQAEAAGKAAAGKKAAATKQAAVTRKVKAKNMKAKKKSRRSGPMMVGLLAAGAVAGLAGAMALRRYREQQVWAEYDTGAALEPMREEVETIEVRTAGPAGAGKASTGAGSSAVASGDSASTTTKTAPPPKPTPTEKVPSVAEGARTTSGRPADDLSKAIKNSPTNSNSRP